jgi:nicotinamidase-related amidase
VTGLPAPQSPEQLLASHETALLLLDVERRFFWQAQGGPELPAASILAPLTRVLDAARARGVMRGFVVTALDPQADSDAWRRRRSYLRVNMPWLAQHSEWGSSLAEPFTPQPDEVVITKLRMSAFHGTALETYLRSRGVTAVILGGVASNGAILATSLDALSRDFHAIVLRDGVTGTSPELHQAAMAIVGAGNLVDTEAVCRVWQHP